MSMRRRKTYASLGIAKSTDLIADKISDMEVEDGLVLPQFIDSAEKVIYLLDNFDFGRRNSQT